ncbi:conserved hypothetical protein [Perkinsus marinus ATCC 50983]|uniref:Uncharacterized protein n=1 Tax=Perkinsus marinus (strain ATCC 50983 / TXsc) TaxID=423536 RepID=C5K743_PERM5|nr:conserved hypothetical protein [Perkinsus marinus ATCC 50983]EER19378.1 conserved hypothetical protein [Perkinsus marinus ATCC 50983]|eukprot:XP_002787582.1 conserved hypothetical protein [Perkinsus marinus ATCC 50983]
MSNNKGTPMNDRVEKDRVDEDIILRAEGDEDEDEEVPLYDPRFRRLSRAGCDSRRESLLHDIAERHSRRPSIQFALDENKITEIPYEEGSIEKVEEITAEGEDDDDDEEEESSDSEQAEEELVPPSGEQRKRSSQGDSGRRRSSLELCSIESKAEHELREREMAHRRSLEKAAADGEAHVDFDAKVEVARYDLSVASSSGMASA